MFDIEVAPASVLKLKAGSSLTIASLLTGLTHDVTVAEHAGGVSRVTFSRTDSLGAHAAAGAAFHVGGVRAIGSSGGGKVTAGWVVRNEYLVRNGGVWPLVAAFETETAIDRVRNVSKWAPIVGPGTAGLGPTISAGRSLMSRVPLVGRAVKTIGSIDFTPEPVRTERLAEVAVSVQVGAATLGALGPKLDVESEFTARLGRADDRSLPLPNRGSTVLELEGRAAASLQAKLLGRAIPGLVDDPSTGADWKLRIEAPDRPMRGGNLIITAVRTEGDLVHQTTSIVDLSSSSAASAALQKAVDELNTFGRSPDGSSARKAIDVLSGVRLPAECVTTMSSTMASTSHVLGLSGEAGEGVGVGAELNLKAERFRTVG